MLMVKATVGPSAIHGLGLFLAEPVRKGLVVWGFTHGLDVWIKEAVLECVAGTMA